MNYKDAGIAVANDLIKTAELQEMIDQSNLFMFDNKGRLSTQKNEKVLNALKGVQGKLPSIANLDLFVQTVDTHLLMVISKNKSKILNKQWVRSNAKWGKAMLATLKRSAAKASTRTSKTKKTRWRLWPNRPRRGNRKPSNWRTIRRQRPSGPWHE